MRKSAWHSLGSGPLDTSVYSALRLGLYGTQSLYQLALEHDGYLNTKSLIFILLPTSFAIDPFVSSLNNSPFMTPWT